MREKLRDEKISEFVKCKMGAEKEETNKMKGVAAC